MRVIEVTSITEEILVSFRELIPQLSSSSKGPTRSQLKTIVSSESARLFVARDPDQGNRIVGTLTLVLFRLPTGMRAWIEDVVVDKSARRQGVGESLCRVAIEQAEIAGSRTVDLTSRPIREAANRLYQRMGFSIRETNVYRHIRNGKGFDQV